MGLILVACGIAVLAVVRPWRDSPDDEDDPPPMPYPPRPSPSPTNRSKTGPRPNPGATRAKRRAGGKVPAEPGRPEIPLPEWLSN